MTTVVNLEHARARRAVDAHVRLVPDPATVAARIEFGELLMAPAELARTLRVSMRQVRRWRTEGMPAVELTPRTYRYLLSDCLRWLTERGGTTPTRVA